MFCFFILKEFEENEFRVFERECDELKRKKLSSSQLDQQYDTLKTDSSLFSNRYIFISFHLSCIYSLSVVFLSLKSVQVLIRLMNSLEKSMSKIESKLCNQDITIEVGSIKNLATDFDRIQIELEVCFWF